MNTKTKKVLFVLFILSALVLSACGGANSEEAPAAAPAEEAPAEEAPTLSIEEEMAKVMGPPPDAMPADFLSDQEQADLLDGEASADGTINPEAIKVIKEAQEAAADSDSPSEASSGTDAASAGSAALDEMLEQEGTRYSPYQNIEGCGYDIGSITIEKSGDPLVNIFIINNTPVGETSMWYFQDDDPVGMSMTLSTSVTNIETGIGLKIPGWKIIPVGSSNPTSQQGNAGDLVILEAPASCWPVKY